MTFFKAVGIVLAAIVIAAIGGALFLVMSSFMYVLLFIGGVVLFITLIAVLIKEVLESSNTP